MLKWFSRIFWTIPITLAGIAIFLWCAWVCLTCGGCRSAEDKRIDKETDRILMVESSIIVDLKMLNDSLNHMSEKIKKWPPDTLKTTPMKREEPDTDIYVPLNGN